MVTPTSVKHCARARNCIFFIASFSRINQRPVSDLCVGKCDMNVCCVRSASCAPYALSVDKALVTKWKHNQVRSGGSLMCSMMHSPQNWMTTQSSWNKKQKHFVNGKTIRTKDSHNGRWREKERERTRAATKRVEPMEKTKEKKTNEWITIKMCNAFVRNNNIHYSWQKDGRKEMANAQATLTHTQQRSRSLAHILCVHKMQSEITKRKKKRSNKKAHRNGREVLIWNCVCGQCSEFLCSYFIFTALYCGLCAMLTLPRPLAVSMTNALRIDAKGLNILRPRSMNGNRTQSCQNEQTGSYELRKPGSGNVFEGDRIVCWASAWLEPNTACLSSMLSYTSPRKHIIAVIVGPLIDALWVFDVVCGKSIYCVCIYGISYADDY